MTETRDFLAQLRGGVSLLAWAESEETIEVLPQHTPTPPTNDNANTTAWAWPKHNSLGK